MSLLGEKFRLKFILPLAEYIKGTCSSKWYYKIKEMNTNAHKVSGTKLVDINNQPSSLSGSTIKGYINKYTINSSYRVNGQSMSSTYKTDLTNNVNLRKLALGDLTQVTSLDLSQCTLLEYASIGGTRRPVSGSTVHCSGVNL